MKFKRLKLNSIEFYVLFIFNYALNLLQVKILDFKSRFITNSSLLPSSFHNVHTCNQNRTQKQILMYNKKGTVEHAIGSLNSLLFYNLLLSQCCIVISEEMSNGERQREVNKRKENCQSKNYNFKPLRATSAYILETFKFECLCICKK